MAAVPLAASPVEMYYGHIGGLRHWMRRYTPFTFIAYKSLIPSHSDDLVGLATKVGDFITFRFFVQFCVKKVTPACCMLPFLPFFFDFGWIMYHWLRGHQIAPVRRDEAPTEPRDRLSSLFFLVFGFSGIYLLNQHLPE